MANNKPTLHQHFRNPNAAYLDIQGNGNGGNWVLLDEELATQVVSLLIGWLAAVEDGKPLTTCQCGGTGFQLDDAGKLVCHLCNTALSQSDARKADGEWV